MKIILENYLPEIVESLKSVDPYRIILFGSLSEGTETVNSDIDLAVILDTLISPGNYKERMNNKLLVRNAILDISFIIPIDLLVYTRKEYAELNEINKPFTREIEKGKILYEKAG